MTTWHRSGTTTPGSQQEFNLGWTNDQLKDGNGNYPDGTWLRLRAANARVPSLVAELRSHMLRDRAKTKRWKWRKGVDNSQAPTLVDWTRENTLKKHKTGKKSGESLLDNVGIKVEMCSTQLHLTLGRDVKNLLQVIDAWKNQWH